MDIKEVSQLERFSGMLKPSQHWSFSIATRSLPEDEDAPE